MSWVKLAPTPTDKFAGILPQFSEYFKGEMYDLALETVRWKGPIEVYTLMGELGACVDVIGGTDEGAVAWMEEWDFAELFGLMEAEGVLTITVQEDGATIVDTPLAPKEPEPVPMKPLRVVELFAGIGAPRRALRNLGIPHTSVMSEIDRYAPLSYCAVHGETVNLGDITKVAKLPPADLIVYGSPCQDISIAGKQAGDVRGSGTRSSLIWEIPRLIRAYIAAGEEPPQVLIGENVANIVRSKHRTVFDEYLDDLKALGYTTSWTIMDPPGYGIPQHRERAFYVSTRDGRRLKFPAPSEVPTRLCDRPSVHHDTSVLLHLTDCAGRGGRDRINDECIRRLTPRECWELMGFDARDEWKAENAVVSVARNGNVRTMSNAQLYKQAGNSMVVQVVEAILRAIYIDGTWTVPEMRQTSLLDWGVVG